MRVSLDPNYKGDYINLSNNKLMASLTELNKRHFVRTNKGIRTGKYYVEFTFLKGNRICFGLVSEDTSISDVNSVWILWGNPNSGNTLSTGSSVCWQSTSEGSDKRGYISGTPDITNDFAKKTEYVISLNSVIGMAIDMDNKTVTFYRDGTLEKTMPGLPDKTFYPAIGITSAGTSIGLPSAASINYGEFGFKYSVPEGYRPYYEVDYDNVVVNTPLVSLDPAIKWTGMDLSDNNLMATTNSTFDNAVGGGFVRATHGASTGKWYFELEVLQAGAYLTVGIINDCNADFNKVCGFTDKWGSSQYQLPKGAGSGVVYVYKDAVVNQAYVSTTDDIDPNSPSTELHPTWVCAAGDIIGVAFNMDDHAIAFYRNGAHLSTVFNLGDQKYYAAFGAYRDTGNVSSTGQFRVNFGDKPFKYFVYSGAAQFHYLAYEKIAKLTSPKVRLDINYKGYGIQLLDNCLTSHLNELQYQKTELYCFVRANYGTNTGKWYWEVYKNLTGATCIGLVSKDAKDKDSASHLGYDEPGKYLCITQGSGMNITSIELVANGYLQTTTDFPTYIDEGSTSYMVKANDTVGFVMDLDSKLLSIYINNTFLRTIEMPANNKEWFAAIGQYLGCFSLDPLPSSATFNFGELTPFKYPIPQENTKPYYLIYELYKNLHLY